MVLTSPERILLIGDTDRRIEGMLSQAVPMSRTTSVATYFDGIAELTADQYTAVLASAEPIERRPEAAVKTLRHLAGSARLVLFGHPTLEPLSRKMLDFGCDDYIVTPAGPGELRQIFSAPILRITPAIEATPAVAEEPPPMPADENRLLAGLPLAEIFLDALAEHPHNAVAEAVARVSQHLTPATQLIYIPATAQSHASPTPPDGRVCISHAVRWGTDEVGQAHLILPRDEDAASARHFLARLSDLIGKIHGLQDRHNRLQKLAITDELTGLYNSRYFRHFLTRIVELARVKRFPVTLFIFDIDNFKKYNDQYGHQVGDEILQQTAALMRRCCREHDLVARIGGDEFAVVFWEKEGPRQPKEPKPVAPPARTPQTPLDILGRFRKLLAKQELRSLGPSGQGVLTISGGLAVYPYDARSVDELIAAADEQLMFKAKQAGKNKIFLVGSGEQTLISDEPIA